MTDLFRAAIALILLVLVSSTESYGDYRTKCKDGMVYIETETESGSWNGQCVKKVGHICKIVKPYWPDEEFSCTPNAKCDDNNVCSCEASYYETVDGHCAKLQINSSCTSSQQCGRDEISRSQLVCDNGKCACNSSESVYSTVERHAYYPSQQTLCAPLPTKNCFQGFCAPGAKCSASAWYVYVQRLNDYNYYYYDGVRWLESALCKCLPPSKLNAVTLQCTSTYNQSCGSNIPCADGLVCSESRCECMARQHYNPHEEKCMSRVDGVCNNNVGCVYNSECYNGICVCKSGYVRDCEGLCISEFGTSCKQDLDCDQRRNDLVCDGEVCVCKPGLQMSLITNRCSVGYNSSCQDSYPCNDDMECTNGFAGDRQFRPFQIIKFVNAI